MGAVVLVPVGSAAAESVETGDTEVGNAGVVILRIPIESRDTEVRAGCLVARGGERIDGVSVKEVPAEPEVVYQIRRQSVDVAEDVVCGCRRRDGAVHR